MRLHPPRCTLFPYTTLFRSSFDSYSWMHYSDAMRWKTNKIGWKIFLDHPLLGVGMGDVREEYFPAYFVGLDRKSTRLNSSHVASSYAVFCLKKKKQTSGAQF